MSDSGFEWIAMKNRFGSSAKKTVGVVVFPPFPFYEACMVCYQIKMAMP